MADANVTPPAGVVPTLPEKWQDMDFGALMMALAIEQSSTCREVIEDQVADMYKRNNEIRLINAALNELRGSAPEEDDEGENFTRTLSPETMAVLEKYNCMEFVRKETQYNISTGKHEETGHYELTKKGGFDLLTQSIKTTIESLSSNNQLDMLKLQSLNNDYTQIIDRATNIESSDKQTKSNITANMR